jgi:TPR repeat protein
MVAPPKQHQTPLRRLTFGRHRLTAILEEYLPIQQDLQFEGAKPSTVVLKQMDQGGWQEYVEARKSFQEAARAGSGAAMYNLGLLYINSWGVTRDYAQAHDRSQKAAEAGNSLAMNNLGVMYAKGEGGAQDYSKAHDWYQNAAEAGNSLATVNLGFAYANGRGATQDYAQRASGIRRPPKAATRLPCTTWVCCAKARYWFQKAAEAVNADATDAQACEWHERGR